MQSCMVKTAAYRAPQFRADQLREYSLYVLHRCSGKALKLLDEQIAEVRLQAAKLRATPS